MGYHSITIEGSDRAAEIHAKVEDASAQRAKLDVLEKWLADTLIYDEMAPIWVALVFERHHRALAPSVDANLHLLHDRSGYAYDYLMVVAKGRAALEALAHQWSRNSKAWDDPDNQLLHLEAVMRLKVMYDGALTTFVDDLDNLCTKLDNLLPDDARSAVTTIRETLVLPRPYESGMRA